MTFSVNKYLVISFSVLLGFCVGVMVGGVISTSRMREDYCRKASINIDGYRIANETKSILDETSLSMEEVGDLYISIRDNAMESEYQKCLSVKPF